MDIQFYKYQGAGNDFVLLDNRQSSFDSLTTKQIAHLCNRKTGIGADGLMLLNRHPEYDFEMIYFNADGSGATMCGNGGRCISAFANDLKATGKSGRFLASDGPHSFEITSKENNLSTVKISMKNVDLSGIEHIGNDFFLHTGSPHYIRFVENVEKQDVFNDGWKIRYDARFKGGTNVNFVQKINENTIKIRTYERGVENETLACGTGATAAALIFSMGNNGIEAVNVQARGGDLTVFFKKENNLFTNVFLQGPATKVFEGGIKI